MSTQCNHMLRCYGVECKCHNSTQHKIADHDLLLIYYSQITINLYLNYLVGR